MMNDRIGNEIAETKFARPAPCGQLVVRGFRGQVVVKTCLCGVKTTSPEELERMAAVLMDGARKLRAQQKEREHGSASGTGMDESRDHR